MANWVNAFYDQEEDLLKWISQNWESYHSHHMVALVTLGVGARMRPKKKAEIVAQVKALYGIIPGIARLPAHLRRERGLHRSICVLVLVL